MNLAGLVAKLILNRSDELICRLNGEPPAPAGGRTPDPRIQLMAARASKTSPPWRLSPQEARRELDAQLKAIAARPEPGVRWRNLAVPSRSGAVPVRLYLPAEQDRAASVLVFGHFGGGVIGSIETCHAFCTILAKLLAAPVVNVDYRLAPEHRFPAGLEDMHDAFEWARRHAHEFGAPRNRARIGGDSIGGNFSAVICQQLRSSGEPQPDAQLLIYPAVDVCCDHPSSATYASAYPLERELLHWFMEHYLEKQSDKGDLRASPLHNSDLSGLAPALVVTAGIDPLVDQGRAYAQALTLAGGIARYREYSSLPHAFTAFTGIMPAARAACDEIAREFRLLPTS